MSKEPKPKPEDKPLPWGPEPRPPERPARCSTCGGILGNCRCTQQGIQPSSLSFIMPILVVFLAIIVIIIPSVSEAQRCYDCGPYMPAPRPIYHPTPQPTTRVPPGCRWTNRGGFWHWACN